MPSSAAGSPAPRRADPVTAGQADELQTLLVAAGADPSNAQAQLELGNALMQAGRYGEAVAPYQRLVGLEPQNPRAHNNLAVAFAEQGRLELALAHYREAVRLEPNFPEAHYNLGNGLRVLKRYDDALACYDAALALWPDWPAAHCNRGLALALQGKQELAEAAYRMTLALDPYHAEAHNNLGLALQIQGQLDDAREYFDRALELAPAFPGAHANRAQLRLLHAEFGEGWPEYEWRWRLPGVGLQPLPIPGWDGSAPQGRTILLRAEQGLGDTIQFVRFAPILQRAGAKVVVECPPQLVPLLATMREVDAVVPRGARLPQCDVQIPLASLPGRMGVLDVSAIPAEIPYLTAAPELVETWRGWLAHYKGFKIGVAWRGSPGHPQDCHRSIPAECFAALAAVRGVRLVSLQAGERARGIPDVVEPASDPENMPLPFDQSAALIAALDLVVTCDTVIAHLAGALGVPVWIALPVVPDWRWLLGRDDSPWYPTARLFRQSRLDEWEPVFKRMVRTLRAARR